MIRRIPPCAHVIRIRLFTSSLLSSSTSSSMSNIMINVKHQPLVDTVVEILFITGHQAHERHIREGGNKNQRSFPEENMSQFDPPVWKNYRQGASRNFQNQSEIPKDVTSKAVQLETRNCSPMCRRGFDLLRECCLGVLCSPCFDFFCVELVSSQLFIYLF